MSPNAPARSPRRTRRPRRAPSEAQQPLLAPAPPQLRPAELRSQATRFIPEDHAQVVGCQPLGEYLAASGECLPLSLREVLHSLDYSTLLGEERRVGRKPFHPRVLLGLVVYATLQGVTGLRRLERLARVDIGAWYVCGGLVPDHTTLGDFLFDNQEKLTEAFFLSVTRQLIAHHEVRPGRTAIDGTVIEAAASAFRTVRLEAAQERARLAEVAAKEAPADSSLAAKARAAQEVVAAVAARKAAREEKGRKPETASVAPSDPDAVIQPLKEGGIAPSYKPSVQTHESGFIVGQKLDVSSEQAAVVPLLEQHTAIFGSAPVQTSLDAGYHNEAVLEEFVGRGIDVLCPPGKESAPGMAPQSDKKLLKSSFVYDEDRNAYRCPKGQLLTLLDRDADERGRPIFRYRVADLTVCAACPLRSRCSKSPEGRTVKRYPGDILKEEMVRILRHPQARAVYSRRKVTVEPTFARLKVTQGLRRFRRRTKPRVAMEFAVHCIAHNIGLSARLRAKAARRRPFSRLFARPRPARRIFRRPADLALARFSRAHRSATPQLR